MQKITTLTVNPALDVNSSIDQVVADEKMRCSRPARAPGGGGVNVGRVIRRLGGRAVVVYTKGGIIGALYRRLLADEEVPQHPIEIAGETRENFIMRETTTDAIYRFGMPGPELREGEWQAVLDYARQMDEGGFLVASGSLPPGVPDDFYGRLADIARRRDLKLVLDTSGPPLKKALEAGVYLAKPNLKELGTLADLPLDNWQDKQAAVRTVFDRYEMEALVLSLGADGAFLLTGEDVEHLPAPDVEKCSAVGAGDSMVGGMVFLLARGASLPEAAAFGIACGAAAITTPGTELMEAGEARRLFEKMPIS